MPTIEEIRRQYPDYRDLSDLQLAKALHTRGYSDLDFGEFSRRMGLADMPSLPTDGAEEFVGTGAPRGKGALASAKRAFGDAVGSRIGLDDYAAAHKRFGPVTPIVDAGATVLDAVEGVTMAGADMLGSAAGAVFGNKKQARRSFKALAQTPIVGAAAGQTLRHLDDLGDIRRKGRGALREAAQPAVNVQAKKGAISRGMARISPEATSERQLRAALTADGLDSAMLAERAQEFQRKTGRAPSLVDIAGENTRALAQNVGGEIGPAREVLENYKKQRVAGQIDRVAELGRRSLSDNFDVLGSVDKLMRQRAAESAPLYEAAYKQVVPVTENMHQIASTVDGKAAVKKALRLISNERLNPEELGFVKKGGSFALGDMMSVQALDYIKLGFRDLFASRKGPNARRLITKNKNAFVADIDRVSPEYAQARAVFKSPSAMIDAMEVGRKTMRSLGAGSADDITAHLRKLSAGEISFYQGGALRGIIDSMERASPGQISVLLQNTHRKKKLEALFNGDKEKAEQFITALEAEARAVSNALYASPNTNSLTHTRGVVSRYFDTIGQFFGFNTALAYKAAGKVADKFGADKILRRKQAANSRSADILTQPVANVPAGLLDLAAGQ